MKHVNLLKDLVKSDIFITQEIQNLLNALTI